MKKPAACLKACALSSALFVLFAVPISGLGATRIPRCTCLSDPLGGEILVEQGGKPVLEARRVKFLKAYRVKLRRLRQQRKVALSQRLRVVRLERKIAAAKAQIEILKGCRQGRRRSSSSISSSSVSRTAASSVSSEASFSTESSSASNQTAVQITQHEITWTFDRAYPVGQFVNGDWWVVGPVTITGVSPAPQDYNFGSLNNWGVKRVHGSMINPSPCSAINPQIDAPVAYDQRNACWNGQGQVSFPLSLQAGQSLVSTRSLLPEDYTNGQYLDVQNLNVANSSYIKSAAILTALAAIPPADAFRPAYAGNNKQIFRASNINWELLPQLTSPPDYSARPSLDYIKRVVQRPWIDHATNFMGRSMHPADNMPNYGREVCGQVGDIALTLVLDYSLAQKEPIAVGLIQIGIDTKAVVELSKDIWRVIAGQNFGRKFPVIFAGKMLSDPSFAIPDAEYSEDCTYFGNQPPPVALEPSQELWTGWQHSGHSYASNVLYAFSTGLDNAGNPWLHEHIPPAGWWNSPFPNNGNQYPGHNETLNIDGKHEGYRRISTQGCVGQTIAARILALTALWNHPAYFAYMDRWMYENESTPGGVDSQIEDAGWDAITHSPSAGVAWGMSGSLNFARMMYLHYRPLYN